MTMRYASLALDHIETTFRIILLATVVTDDSRTHEVYF